jgi:uncharacterized protein (TIGR00369 family)
MEFFETDDAVESRWAPKGRFEGYNSVLHGGIQATMMDEIASWYVFVKLETAGVTAGMSVDFHRPVYTDRGTLHLAARLEEMKKNIAHIRVELRDAEGALCADGVCRYFTYPQKIARRRLDYPGHEAFFD